MTVAEFKMSMSAVGEARTMGFLSLFLTGLWSTVNSQWIVIFNIIFYTGILIYCTRTHDDYDWGAYMGWRV